MAPPGHPWELGMTDGMGELACESNLLRKRAKGGKIVLKLLLFQRPIVKAVENPAYGRGGRVHSKGQREKRRWRRTVIERALTPGDKLFVRGAEVVLCAMRRLSKHGFALR